MFVEEWGKMLGVVKREIIGDLIKGVVCRWKLGVGYLNRVVMNEMEGG